MALREKFGRVAREMHDGIFASGEGLHFAKDAARAASERARPAA